MKLVVQRVARASVRAEGELLGAIGQGMLVLLCAMAGDGPAEAERLAERLAHYRFFPDADGRMNRSALDVGAACLVVSQFTLAADGSKGRRPSFDRRGLPQFGGESSRSGWAGWLPSTAGPIQLLYACDNVRTVEYGAKLNLPPMAAFVRRGSPRGRGRSSACSTSSPPLSTSTRSSSAAATTRTGTRSTVVRSRGSA